MLKTTHLFRTPKFKYTVGKVDDILSTNYYYKRTLQDIVFNTVNNFYTANSYNARSLDIQLTAEVKYYYGQLSEPIMGVVLCSNGSLPLIEKISSLT